MRGAKPVKSPAWSRCGEIIGNGQFAVDVLHVALGDFGRAAFAPHMLDFGAETVVIVGTAGDKRRKKFGKLCEAANEPGGCFLAHGCYSVMG